MFKEKRLVFHESPSGDLEPIVSTTPVVPPVAPVEAESIEEAPGATLSSSEAPDAFTEEQLANCKSAINAGSKLSVAITSGHLNVRDDSGNVKGGLTLADGIELDTDSTEIEHFTPPGLEQHAFVKIKYTDNAGEPQSGYVATRYLKLEEPAVSVDTPVLASDGAVEVVEVPTAELNGAIKNLDGSFSAPANLLGFREINSENGMIQYDNYAWQRVDGSWTVPRFVGDLISATLREGVDTINPVNGTITILDRHPYWLPGIFSVTDSLRRRPSSDLQISDSVDQTTRSGVINIPPEVQNL